MGAGVLASVFYACFLLTEAQNIVGPTSNFIIEPIPVRSARHTDELEETKGLLVGGGIHSALPAQENPEVSATNYDPYGVQLYKFSAEDAKSPYHVYGYNGVGSYEARASYNEFASVEADPGGYEHNLDTTGYNHYKTATSFALEGPKQLETITTHSYHKESEPFDVSGFHKSHKEDEEHAEVHYHQHKHLHKHNHRQEHMHKHQQDHKHEHGHNHDHHAQHEHKHDSVHKHGHNSDHKHVHKSEQHHNHQQDHKHTHHSTHRHDHKHQQEHKHDQHHNHKHSHHGEHKHSHHSEHKHDHHHGHKHENQHKHKHDHHELHKHHHGHKEGHKHKHHSSHYHKSSQHKY